MGHATMHGPFLLFMGIWLSINYLEPYGYKGVIEILERLFEDPGPLSAWRHSQEPNAGEAGGLAGLEARR